MTNAIIITCSFLGIHSIPPLVRGFSVYLIVTCGMISLCLVSHLCMQNLPGLILTAHTIVRTGGSVLERASGKKGYGDGAGNPGLYNLDELVAVLVPEE